MRCLVCRLDHISEYAPGGYVPTRAGYLLLATWRAEQNARERHGELVQALVPSSDVAGGVRETTTGADAAAARGSIRRNARA